MMGTFVPSNLVGACLKRGVGGNNASHGAMPSPRPVRTQQGVLLSVWVSLAQLLFSDFLTKSRLFRTENPHRFHHRAWLLSWTLMYRYFPCLSVLQSPHSPGRLVGTSIARLVLLAVLPLMAWFKGISGVEIQCSR